MKKKIVIASVLKPVDDVRTYWKLSQSIAKTNKYEVNIIGNEGKKASPSDNIKFHPYLVSKKKWFQRWVTREKILFKIIQLKPVLLIITTHELLTVAFMARLLTGCKVIYDVQENYSVNLSHITPTIGRRILASLVSLKEQLSQFYISEYWLAETCYADELSFVKGKHVAIENKAYYHPIPSRKWAPIKLIFSGTISHYGGVKNTLKLFSEIQKKEPEISIHFIGQIHDSSLYEWLLEKQKKQENILLTISENPIPHPEILQAISEANLGIIGYLPSLVNQNKMPTKLFEYSRYRLPYIVQENTKWAEKGLSLGGAIPIDFENYKVETIIEKLKNASNFFTESYPASETWEYEANQVVTSINKLINHE